LRPPGAASGADFPELALQISATLARLRAAREVTVGCSLKEPVWSCGKTTLYRYAPLTATRWPRPVLICFALVNRPYVLDLQPDRSLVRAFGLPTRNEIDALYAQVKDLRQQLAELAAAAGEKRRAAPQPAPRKARSSAPRSRARRPRR